MSRRTVLLGGGAAVLAACASGPDAEDAAPDPTATPVSSPEATSLPGAQPTTTPPDPAEPDAPTGEPEPPDDVGELADFSDADFAPLAICAALPQTAAGPFPTDEQLVRRDVTEGYPGHPVRLGLRVVDAACTPVNGASVEIWHTDATGDYSAYEDNGSGKDEGAGSTFMRGNQTTGDDGIVEFATIYPGWYEGRAVHIHVRVWIGSDLALTTQVYFDDDYTLGVFATGPYAEFGAPDTTNATDGLAGDISSDGTLLTVRPGATRHGEGSVALANIGIA